MKLTLSKFKASLTVIAVLSLAVLFLSSTTFFRLKIARYYSENERYEEAVKIYHKILRKEESRNYFSPKLVSHINFMLGHLYSRLLLENLAIEYYAKSALYLSELDLKEYFYKHNFDIDKLMVLGLLEGGNFKKADEVSHELGKIYTSSSDFQKFQVIALQLIDKQWSPSRKKDLFKLGETYIYLQLFEAARGFFVKRIVDYGVSNLEVLTYLKDTHSDNIPVKQRIWGDEFFVTLEDFEVTDTQLLKWLGRISARVNSQYIDNSVAYRSTRSEWLDISDPT